MPDWKAYVVDRFGAHDLDEDVIEEVAEHAEEQYRAAIATGRTDAESRSAVEAELNDLPTVLRAARARRPGRIPAAPDSPASGRLLRFDACARDLAHGVRVMLASPAVSLVAVLTLALAIGANTAVFSVAHALLFEAPPFPAADRLVMVWEADADDPDDLSIVAAPNYQDWIRLSTSFESLGIWEHLTFNLAGPDPEQVTGLRVSSSMFTVLGVAPQLGRTFSPEEDQPGHDVAVISDGLWRRRFGADPSVLGRRLGVNGRPVEIIGVMPGRFRFTRQRDDIWIPIQFTEQDRARGSHSFFVAARLNEGVDFATAKTEMLTIGRQLAASHEDNAGELATITRLDELGVADLEGTLKMLLGAVGLVLLIACVNVANLLLVRAAGRHREFAIRTALGAGRARLAMQLLTEGLLLALAGSAAGILLAWAGTASLSAALPASIRLAPFRAAGGVSIAPAVLLFTAGVSVLSGLLFSLAPIAALWRASPDAALKASGDRGGTARLTWLRHALVASEIALALVLLAAAGLTIKSMMRVVAVDPGFETDSVLTMRMALPQTDTYGAPERPRFCDAVAAEVGPLPGVLFVGAVSHLPLSGANAGRGFAIEGRPQPPPNEGAGAFYRVTCPGYFATLGIPIVAGRDFSADDTLRAPMVVIVNESTAAKYWPGETPLGERIKFGDLSSDTPWLTIVGIVRDVRHFGLDTDAYREIYRPYSQTVWPVMTVTAKTAVEPLTLASAARAALRRIDADQPVSNVRSMEQVLEESLGARRFPMLLLGLFSAVAFTLAAIGVYGVVGYLVSLRTREIGIRVALGAGRSSVVRLMLTRSLVPVVVGIAAGLAGAVASGRFVESLLFQVRPVDTLVLAATAALLGGTAIVASWIPARRAASVDPTTVLREE
jgi:putative ABC transport system permease protein